MKTYEQILESEKVQEKIKHIKTYNRYSTEKRNKKLEILYKRCERIAQLSATYELVADFMEEHVDTEIHKHLCFIESLMNEEEIRLWKFLNI